MLKSFHYPFSEFRSRCLTVGHGAALAAWFLILQCHGPAHAEDTRADFQPPLDTTFIAEIDQSEQHYVLLLPLDHAADTSRDLMVALHGHGSDRWQFVNSDRGECRAARDVAAENGMIYISPDYRAPMSWMGREAEADLVQIIREAKSTFTIRHVILVGGSMGGSSALTFAALHPDRVDGVVAMNATANHLEYEKFQEAITASFGGAKRDVPEEYYRRSAEYSPLSFTMPIAFTTSGRDTAVPPDSVLRLAAILMKLFPDVHLTHRPGAGHATSYDDAAAAIRFVVERLAARAGAGEAPLE